MSTKFALLLFVLVAIVACVQAQPSRSFYRIVGGDEIGIFNVPFMVSLQYFHRHHCGGSLLNHKWVLTAAHCTEGRPANSFEVRLGSSQHAAGGIVVRVLRTIEHPQYVASIADYDFSLIELERMVIFGDVIKPVTLPNPNEPVRAGTMAMVAGWGDTRNVHQSNATLRAVYVPITSQEDCRRAHFTKSITDRMLCAGYPQGGMDACKSDSGGPLIADGKLVGVVSWGADCAKAGLPGVYGRVASVREWICNISCA